MDKMFTNAYTRQSLSLSHVSSQWRRVALSVPQLWPLSTAMHPDAFGSFLERTRRAGMHVQLRSRCDPAQCTRIPCAAFLDMLQHDFHRIKSLTAVLHSTHTVLRTTVTVAGSPAHTGPLGIPERE